LIEKVISRGSSAKGHRAPCVQIHVRHLITILISLVPMLAHADRLLGKQPDRVAFPGDLAGTWKVELRTKYSSCQGTPSESIVTWAVIHANDTWTVHDDAAFRVSGTPRRAGTAYFRSTLKPHARASGTALQLEYYYKDRFHGTLMLAEPVPGNPKDPICLTVRSVTARKVRR
jgi:hypothetical protein